MSNAILFHERILYPSLFCFFYNFSLLPGPNQEQVNRTEKKKKVRKKQFDSISLFFVSRVVWVYDGR